jgi:hypothetical protein
MTSRVEKVRLMFEFVLFSDVLFEIDHLDQLGLGNVAEGRCIDRLMPCISISHILHS